MPLVQRKRRLARIMPRVESRLMLLEAIPVRGRRLFELACERGFEGIVAKHRAAPYSLTSTRTFPVVCACLGIFFGWAVAWRFARRIPREAH